MDDISALQNLPFFLIFIISFTLFDAIQAIFQQL